MPRGDPKPRVAYHWRQEGYYTHARCRLCGFSTSDTLRSRVLVSTAQHKLDCPVLRAWTKRQRDVYLTEIGALS